MKKFITALILLLACAAVQSQTVNKLEYFVDIDKGVGKNKLVSVTASADGTFPFTVNLSNVSAGYHKLYIRAKDSKGNWSLAARQTIQVLPNDSKSIFAKGEYFFDTDPGFGKAKKINISTQDSIVTQTFTAAVTNLQTGYHKLYLRTQDSYGSWSQTTRYNIQVTKTTGTDSVIEVEYFFTNDKGVGNCASVMLKPSANGTFKFKIPKNKVPANAQNLFVRVKDSANGDWSLTQIDTLSNNNFADNLLSAQLQPVLSVSIHPNPASNYFNIYLKGFEKTNDVTMIIKDISGRTLLTQKIISNTGQRIDVSGFAKGIYFVTIINSRFSQTLKLVVE